MKRTLEDLIAALGGPGALEAAGGLVAIGAGDRILPDVPIDLAIGDLMEDAFAALAAIDRSSIEDLRRAFAARDAVELRLLGAEAILGRSAELSLEEETALIAFEEAIRPHLWRLTALNDWRALEVDWIAKEHRARFWWWSEASDIDPRAAPHLDVVAELVARFPAAEDRLRKIAVTDLLLHQPSASVIDLAAWIRSRSAVLPMAASTGQREQVLLEHASFTLSLLPPDTLLIDLLERALDRPRIQTEGAVLESEPVPDAIERYRFDLGSLPERTARAELIVSLASGVVRLRLPPD